MDPEALMLAMLTAAEDQNEAALDELIDSATTSSDIAALPD